MESHGTSLAELVSQSAYIESKLVESGGELTPELESALATIQLAIPEKIDAYQFVIERLKVAAAHWKVRAKSAQAVAKGCENGLETLRGAIKAGMLALKADEILGIENRFVLANSKPTLEIFDEAQLPAHCIKEVVEYVPDKDKIRELLEAGSIISGARLVPNKSLRSYMNKSETKKKVSQKNGSKKLSSKKSKK